MNAESSKTEGPVGIWLESTQFSVVPGNSASIAFVLENKESGEDYFEVSVNGLSSSWISQLPPVILLSPGEKREVAFTVQPPGAPAAVMGKYPFAILISSQKSPEKRVEIEATLTVAAFAAQGRIGLLLASTQYSVVPGSSVSVPLMLTNQGLEMDSLRLSVEGIPSSWVSARSPLTQLPAGEEKMVSLTILPPASPQSRAGRHKFTIRVTSQQDPTQFVEAEVALTIAALSKFRGELIPQQIRAGETATVTVWNEGNFEDSYDLTWTSANHDLIFNPPQVLGMRLPPGEATAIQFTASPRRGPFFGGEFHYPFTTVVQSAEKESQHLQGAVQARGILPVWVLAPVLVACLAVLCASAFFFSRDRLQASSATQTAAANQTAAAVIGEVDTDGDGLTDQAEIELGSDPNNPDTDGDGLRDGEESQLGTDLLSTDSDGDGVPDGDEVQRGTNPSDPDTDGDGLADGNEIQSGSDPLNPDSDEDGISDGDEVQRGTNPLDADTDRDQLQDGDEIERGSDPLNPDSDGDGVVDGLDLDPTDPGNPSLTETAAAGATATLTLTPPVETPTTAPPASPTAPPPATTTPSPVEGTIVFESNREGSADIFSLDARAGAISRLTQDPGVDSQPAWSPNGDRIAFTSNREGNNEIYLMNPDGTGLVNLTNNPADDQYPAWSLDGQWIAFATDRDGNQEIYVMRTDGSEVKNLTNNPAVDSQPSWFPTGVLLLTGSKIAFTSDRDGNLEIYLVNPDGSDQVNLTSNAANDAFPAASPDGSRIAFVSERDGDQEIYVMAPDGSALANLSNNPASDTQPAWSPLGDWLAFATNRDGNQEIYVMNNDGSGQFNLTNHPAEDVDPTWK